MGVKGGLPARKADLTAVNCPENVVASTSHNTMGLHSLLHGYFFLLYDIDFSILLFLNIFRI
jgi:hypothetical protein